MVKNKQVIAVDLDDVLAEHIEAFIEFSNKNHGTNFTKQDYLEQWKDLWGISYGEVEERALNFLTNETVGGFGVIEDAYRVLDVLKKERDLVIVTARPKHTIDSTLEWVDHNFPATFSGVHFVPIWDPGPKKTKAEICKEIGADYLIDDLIRHCNLAIEGRIKALWFARIGWRQPDKLHSDVVRMASWREVLEYFETR